MSLCVVTGVAIHTAWIFLSWIISREFFVISIPGNSFFINSSRPDFKSLTFFTLQLERLEKFRTNFGPQYPHPMIPILIGLFGGLIDYIPPFPNTITGMVLNSIFKSSHND